MLKDGGGNIPIHIACRERASKSVIEVLLSEEPESSKVQDEEGRLALHLACRHGTSIEVVDSLIKHHFYATCTKDMYHTDSYQFIGHVYVAHLLE